MGITHASGSRRVNGSPRRARIWCASRTGAGRISFPMATGSCHDSGAQREPDAPSRQRRRGAHDGSFNEMREAPDMMKRVTGAAVARAAAGALVGLLLAKAALAAGFLFYPGSTPYRPPDTEANRQWTSALRPGTTITAWFTSDSFEQVVGFYRSIAREYIPPRAPPAEKLPNGQRLQKTFLIFDGAPDPASSKQWVSIQHPFVGAITMRE